jgi:hypothetical protein
MFRITLATVAVALLVAMTGCSSLTVYSDWDDNAEFAEFRSFKLLDRTQPARDELVERRVRESVRASLVEMGFTENTTSPDFLVAIHGQVEDKVDVQTYNYGYPYYGYPYWHGGRDVSVSQYQEGTLIIDFVDASDNELFWRGWGTKILDHSTRDESVIRGVVDKILDQYPPR